MSKNIDKIRPILDLFQQINLIPRKSGSEQAISDWLVQWAKEHNLPIKQDKVGNILIKVPGTGDFKKADPVILQGHMDMVCQKESTSNHDFSKDPIKLVYDGDWVKANGTTLGADNGIGMALALYIAQAADLEHPPLEILITIDEETGLNGAKHLKPDWLKGEIMINLDSDEEGVFTVGCAGGVDAVVSKNYKQKKMIDNLEPLEIKIEGGKSGHSGVDIDKPRINAFVLLFRFLTLVKKEVDLYFVSIKGGSARNSIAGEASTVVLVKSEKHDDLIKIGKDFNKIIAQENQKTNPTVQLLITGVDKKVDSKALSAQDSREIIDFISAFPHGVDSMSKEIDNLVETSNNLAIIKLEEGNLEIISSQRSSVASKLEALTDKIEALANLMQADFKKEDGYPGWEPDMDSTLVSKSKKVYKEVFKKEPKVEAVHAGLECGLIGEKYPTMKMISIGATIKDAHSVKERLSLASVEKTLIFLTALLKTLG